MAWNEDSRVKIPAILHSCKLGYDYISIKKTVNDIDQDTNIFKDIFTQSLKRINPDKTERDLINKFTGIANMIPSI